MTYIHTKSVDTSSLDTNLRTRTRDTDNALDLGRLVAMTFQSANTLIFLTLRLLVPTTVLWLLQARFPSDSPLFSDPSPSSNHKEIYQTFFFFLINSFSTSFLNRVVV